MQILIFAGLERMMESNEKGIFGESFVSVLTTGTFLDYWCYPNPYDELGDKKEICDLLILFKEYCIICQVKNYEFKNNHERYFRKTVESAAKQIQGAERKLFQSNRDIYIKHPDKRLVVFDKKRHYQIVRLAIHLGDGVQYKYLGKQAKIDQEFIHFIGKEDLEYLLNELKTISDFVDYLKARESFATKIEKVMILGTEKDLLGLYLNIKPRFEEFVANNKGQYLLLNLENSWENIKSQLIDNEDILLNVENLIYDWVKEDLVLNEVSRGVAEDLMSLNRHERRVFAISMITIMDEYFSKSTKTIVRRHIVLNKLGFVFFLYPETIAGVELEQLMTVAAEGFAYYTNYEVTKLIVVGISEKNKINFTLADFTNFKFFQIDELKKVLNYLGWFQENKLTHWNIDLISKEK